MVIINNGEYELYAPDRIILRTEINGIYLKNKIRTEINGKNIK